MPFTSWLVYATPFEVLCVCELVGIQYAMYFLRIYYVVDVVCGCLGSYSDVVGVSSLFRYSGQPLLLD